MQLRIQTTWSAIKLQSCLGSVFLGRKYPHYINEHQFVIQKQRNMEEGEQQQNSGNDPPIDPPPNLTDQLLGSSSVLQALGRQLAPITASPISPANASSSTTSTILLWQHTKYTINSRYVAVSFRITSIFMSRCRPLTAIMSGLTTVLVTGFSTVHVTGFSTVHNISISMVHMTCFVWFSWPVSRQSSRPGSTAILWWWLP